MKKLSIVGFSILLYATALNAEEITHGEMAAAIRSANFPCSHVLELQKTGNNTWKVDCNAGPYTVSKSSDGHYTVSAIGKSQPLTE